MPEVSVIIPVYNNEKFVEKCIRSVMEQSFQDLEILVVNDGSTDRSNEILKRLVAEDSRIIYFSQENRGVALARNRALDMASGKYLTFVTETTILVETILVGFIPQPSRRTQKCLSVVLPVWMWKEMFSVVLYPVSTSVMKGKNGHFGYLRSGPTFTGAVYGKNIIPASAPRRGGRHANFLVF